MRATSSGSTSLLDTACSALVGCRRWLRALTAPHTNATPPPHTHPTPPRMPCPSARAHHPTHPHRLPCPSHCSAPRQWRTSQRTPRTVTTMESSSTGRDLPATSARDIPVCHRSAAAARVHALQQQRTAPPTCRAAHHPAPHAPFPLLVYVFGCRVIKGFMLQTGDPLGASLSYFH